jgi:Domain of unknown function (DUF4278)
LIATLSLEKQLEEFVTTMLTSSSKYSSTVKVEQFLEPTALITSLSSTRSQERFTMKLKYRGVAYDWNPATVTDEPTALTGRYRGIPYGISTLTTEIVPQTVFNLVYRGVPYQIGDLTPEDIKQADQMTPTIAQALLEEAALRLKYLFHHPINHS